MIGRFIILLRSKWKRESHMVNFKKILVLLQLFVRFLTPITLRAETNIE